MFAIPRFLSRGGPRLTRAREEFRFLAQRRNGVRFLPYMGRAGFPASRRRLLFVAPFLLGEPLMQASGLHLLLFTQAGSFLLQRVLFFIWMPL